MVSFIPFEMTCSKKSSAIWARRGQHNGHVASRSQARDRTRELATVALFGVLATIGIVGCSSNDHGDHHAEHDTSVSIGCSGDSRVAPFATGMQAKSVSGRLVAEIVSAAPSPPERGAGDAGINTWTMRLSLDGAPLQGAVSAKAFMPDHAHSSPKVPVVTANGDGTHTLSNLFLFMAGVWEITLTAGNESATITICVN